MRLTFPSYAELDELHRSNHPELFIQPEGDSRSLEYITDLINSDNKELFVAKEDSNIIGLAQRRSRRQFDGRTLSHDLLSHLLDFSQNLNEHVLGARAVVVTETPDEIFKGAIGSYGKIKGAPPYVAFLGNMKDPNVQEKVGILGEFFILEATSIGLATCWLGGCFRPDVVQTHIRLNADEQVLAVSPIGFAKEQLTFEEKVMVGLASSHKRKNLETLLLSLPENPLANWMSTALDAARLAPSTVNRQPWRFSVENGTLRVSFDNNRHSAHVSKRLDCGIAMAHIEVGAKHKGVTGLACFVLESRFIMT